MKKLFNLIVKIALWWLVVMFTATALAFFPSLTSVFALLFAVIVAPISRLQGILNQIFRTRKRKIITLVVLFVLTFSLVPSSPAVEEQPEPVAQVIATEKPEEELIKEDPSPTPEILLAKETTKLIESKFEIHFLDVGQADSMLVLCDDQAMLIDGGDPDDSSFIYTYLKDSGIEHLDVIVCTHEHSDHVGGLAGALNYATVGTAYAPVSESENSAFISFVEYLNRQNVDITIPAPGDVFNLGSSTVTVVGPINPSNEPNNTSIVLRIEYGETSFLLTGDAEIEEENDILNAGYNLESTVLKVGHHGSSTSSGPGFIAAVNPEYAVISDGIDASGFGRLTESTLEKLQAAGAEIYRTDLQGNIICTSDGKTVSFSVEKEAVANELLPLVLELQAPDTTQTPAVRGMTMPEPAIEPTPEPALEPIPESTPEPTPVPTPEATPEPTPEPTPEGRTYILNKNSKKFHYPSCSSVGKMKESNKGEIFGSRDELKARGYEPCGNCHP